jgi:PAS domain S-box-containing protein
MNSKDRSKEESLRARAEKILSREPEAIRKMPPEDITRLIHELEVHQIELDMQNDELRKAQTEIELSRAKYVDLYDFAPIGYFTFTATGTIEEVNLTGAKLLGIERTNLVNRDFRFFIAPESRRLFDAHRSEVLASDSPEKCELKLVRKDGTSLDVSLESVSVKSGSRSASLIRSAVSDIAERKKMEMALRETENQLRIVSAQRLEALETERKRIAMELHDSVLGTLSGLKFKVETLILNVEQGHGNPGLPTDFVPLIQAAMKEIRRIMSDLRPTVLDDLGVVAAASFQCRQFEEMFATIRVEKRVDLSEEDIPGTLKLPVYRIVQEALNNIGRHSKADLVNVSLKKTDHSLELVIQDNGQGFDVQQALSTAGFKRGLGLDSLCERAQWSGGFCSIESSIGKGTVIRASWPLDENGQITAGSKD